MKIFLKSVLGIYLIWTGVVVLVVGLIYTADVLNAFAGLESSSLANWFPFGYTTWVLLTGVGLILGGGYAIYHGISYSEYPSRKQSMIDHDFNPNA